MKRKKEKKNGSPYALKFILIFIFYISTKKLSKKVNNIYNI